MSFPVVRGVIVLNLVQMSDYSIALSLFNTVALDLVCNQYLTGAIYQMVQEW